MLSLHGQATGQPNIILIIADDFNDFIEPLDAHPDVETPNINLIANNGTTFLNAYCPSPLCGPSRTSFLTGKDVAYTQVYTNEHYKCWQFEDNFSAALGNEEYYTMPGYLKNTGGYYTYNINKIFHCHQNTTEYDDIEPDPCAKTQSWNKYFVYSDTSIIDPIAMANNDGVNGWAFGRLNDTLEKYMTDFVATDSAIAFIDNLANDPSYICNKPFFLALGFAKPHKEHFIPEKYFSDYYLPDFYVEPYNYPFNNPLNSYPPNGIILSPQPEVVWEDFYSLPIDSIGQEMAGRVDYNFEQWAADFDPLPEIDPGLNDSARQQILAWSERANALMAYLAAVKFVDAQVGRVYEALLAHPEIYNNTVIIFIGDHGFSLGEKKHWGKYAMWETDVRTSLIIADLRNPEMQVTERTVSLMDLYPTICDIAGLSHPLFQDGSYYLDGYSTMPIINNPTLPWEHPIITTIKSKDTDEAHCFPQFSIRNEKFHYIRYQSNGGGDTICDEANSYIEEELYELGINREIDPHEWNNLIQDDDYQSVVTYLQQWLPDSALYLKKTYAAAIQNNPVDCILAQDDTLFLHADLFDTTGTPVLMPAGYKYIWSNNLTGDLFEGVDAVMPVQLLSDDLFDVSSRILFYFQMIDTATNAIVAFDTKYFYLNPINAPEISFNVLQTGTQTVSVTDLSVSGTYNNIWWDFGEGNMLYEQQPGPYTYASPGDYTITCYVQYGNNPDCIITYEKVITTIDENVFPDNKLLLFPNPTDDLIYVISTNGNLIGEFTIFNLLGQQIKMVDNQDLDLKVLKIDVSDLQQGLYFIENNSNSTAFIVL